MRQQGLVSRRSSQSGKANLKPPLKEKFVYLYEDVFSERSPIQAARQEGFAGRQALQRFWDELFLLKVNEAYLSQCISSIPEEKLTGSLRHTMNELFGACVRYMSDGNFIRVAHAIETFTVLLREIFKKRFSEQAFTIITLVAGGADNGDAFFKKLIEEVSALLLKEHVPALVKALGTRLFLVILTGTDNVNTNPIASFLFVHPISEPLLAVLTLKVPQERARLELDAAIVLILLLLWRSSTNSYANQVSSPSGPLVSLLHTTGSLLARPRETRQANLGMHPSPRARPTASLSFATPASSTNPLASLSPFLPESALSAVAAVYEILGGGTTGAGAGGGAGIGVGQGSAGGAGGSEGEVVDLGWSNTTAATLILYFLVHLNPSLRSQVLWPPNGFSATQGQSLAILWSGVLRAFLAQCHAVFSSIERASTVAQAQSVFLTAKVALLIQRMLLEDRVSGDFVSRCDAATFQLIAPLPQSPTAAPSPGSPGAPRETHAVSARCISHVFFDSAVVLLGVPLPVSAATRPHSLSCSASAASPASSAAAGADVDAYIRALTVVSVVINSARHRGTPLSSVNVDWMALWRALVLICDWCSVETNFQRPGVPELAESALGLVEACLGGGTEVVASLEDVETLHGMVFAFMGVFEELERTAQKSPFAASRLSVTGGFKLVNVKAMREHYEVMAASMGIRTAALGGVAMSEEQALSVIRRKGVASLKLRPRHAGPAHSYSEGNSELRILTALAKLLVAEHRRTFWVSLPKFELESF